MTVARSAEGGARIRGFFHIRPLAVVTSRIQVLGVAVEHEVAHRHGTMKGCFVPHIRPWSATAGRQGTATSGLSKLLLQADSRTRAGRNFELAGCSAIRKLAYCESHSSRVNSRLMSVSEAVP